MNAEHHQHPDHRPPAPAGPSEPRATPRDAHAVLLLVIRAVFVVLITVVTGLGILTVSAEGPLGAEIARFAYLGIAAGIIFAGCVIGIDLLTPERKLSAIMAIVVGSFAGVLATIAFGFVIDLIAQTFGFEDDFQRFGLVVKLILGLGLCYLGITTVLQTQDNVRLAIPYVEFAKQYRGVRPLLLDTSALIDARLAELAATGLIQAPLVAHRAVIDELHALSDAPDRLKRAKGRRGLDTLARLRRLPDIDISIDEAPVTSKSTDQTLVERAASMPASIVTLDAAVSRIARVQGVHAINLHEVARAVRLDAIPGEPIDLELTKPGEQPRQAAGYLDDGTMVVVEHAHELVGTRQRVLVTNTVQTSGGRLIFAKLEHPPHTAPPHDAEAATPDDNHTPDPHHTLNAPDPPDRPESTDAPSDPPTPQNPPAANQRDHHHPDPPPVRPHDRPPAPSRRNPRRG